MSQPPICKIKSTKFVSDENPHTVISATLPGTVMVHLAPATTHTQNQVYQICIRRESSYCYICYSAWHSSPAGSFGLSIGPTAAIAKARVSTACIDDYVVIPGGHTSAIAAIGDPTVASISKFCGRYLATSDTATEISICCKLQKLWTFCIFHCFFCSL